jgi:hypothetical protein
MRMKTIAIGICCGLLTAALVAQEPIAQPRGGPLLRGMVVVDDGSGRPLRRATVSIRDAASGVDRTEMSDDQGRFTFTLLARARFSLTATKLGYVTTYHGSVQPGRKPGGTLELPAGQRDLAVTIKMLRGAAISGRVRDSGGRAVAGVHIDVLEARGPSGSRLLLAAPTFSAQPAVTTDEHGDYRIWGLLPGSFVVQATRSAPNPDPGRRITTAAEIQWALLQLRPGGPGPAASIAAARPLSANAVMTSSVYYPDAINAAGAVAIPVTAGQDRTGVDVVLTVKTVAGGS